MTDFDKGDTVRLTLEGVVTDRGDYVVRLDDGGIHHISDFNVEVLKKAEPVWSDSDVILEHNEHSNHVWTRHEGKWHRPGSEWSVSDQTISTMVGSKSLTILRQQVTND